MLKGELKTSHVQIWSKILRSLQDFRVNHKDHNCFNRTSNTVLCALFQSSLHTTPKSKVHLKYSFKMQVHALDATWKRPSTLWYKVGRSDVISQRAQESYKTSSLLTRGALCTCRSRRTNPGSSVKEKGWDYYLTGGVIILFHAHVWTSGEVNEVQASFRWTTITPE